MRKVILFGATQFANLLTYYLTKSDEYEIAAYTVDTAYIPSVSEKVGYPVIPFEVVEKEYPPEEYGVFLCVGYSKMNCTRKQAYLRTKQKGYDILSYIHPTATVLAEKVGEGTVALERAIIGPFAEIGIGNIIWAGANIAHDTKIGNFNFFAIESAVAGNVKIGDHCFFGNNCTIKNGIRISDYTLVGAGCYVAHDTEAYSVHVPARSVVLAGKRSLDIRLTQG
jgi:sugar O-acyltransferase (sialic acid O-acetyltransferase NeuD family)